MRPPAETARVPAPPRRRIRPTTYLLFFLLFGVVVFLSHGPLVRLPYFWDEAGQFIPAALDILHGGHWIPRSATPNIHPPAVTAYLAAAWRIAGFHPATTRTAMLLLAVCAVLVSFLLAIELSREVRGVPAFLAAGLLCASPLFFAQGMLAQLDAPAMLFTALALLLFLQERPAWSAAACVALVLVKETGAVVPLIFLSRLLYERRPRQALYFAAPLAVLAVWIGILRHATGNWAGNPAFASYNLYYPAHPLRIIVTLLRRIYYLAFANFHWIGIVAILYAWRKSRLFQSRSWRVAWLVLAAHVVMLTVLGGAVLDRYLLPVVPILYAAMAAALSFLSRATRVICSLALVCGLVAANFINPFYPFPYENNLSFSDFVKLQQDAADYLENWYPRATVHTVWPMTAELSNPALGYVRHEIAVRALPDFSSGTLRALDWSNVQVLVAYSHTWEPGFSTMRFAPVAKFWRRYYGYVRNVSQEESRSLVPMPIEAHFERRGQWVDIYVNPAMPQLRDKGLQRVAY